VGVLSVAAYLAARNRSGLRWPVRWWRYWPAP